MDDDAILYDDYDPILALEIRPEPFDFVSRLEGVYGLWE